MIPVKCLVHVVNIYLNQQPLRKGQALFGSDDRMPAFIEQLQTRLYPNSCDHLLIAFRIQPKSIKFEIT